MATFFTADTVCLGWAIVVVARCVMVILISEILFFLVFKTFELESQGHDLVRNENLKERRNKPNARVMNLDLLLMPIRMSYENLESSILTFILDLALLKVSAGVEEVDLDRIDRVRVEFYKVVEISH